MYYVLDIGWIKQEFFHVEKWDGFDPTEVILNLVCFDKACFHVYVFKRLKNISALENWRIVRDSILIRLEKILDSENFIREFEFYKFINHETIVFKKLPWPETLKFSSSNLQYSYYFWSQYDNFFY